VSCGRTYRRKSGSLRLSLVNLPAQGWMVEGSCDTPSARRGRCDSILGPSQRDAGSLRPCLVTLLAQDWVVENRGVRVVQVPDQRIGHVAFAVGHRIYVYGGRNYLTGHFYDNVYMCVSGLSYPPNGRSSTPSTVAAYLLTRWVA
jgi:hypothetical protein